MRTEGENVLATIREVCNASILAHTAEHAEDTAVYFDVFGLFTVVYSSQFAFYLNCFTAIFALLLLSSQKWLTWNAVRASFVLLASFVVAIVFAAAMGAFVSLVLGLHLSWYAQPSLAVGMYGCPALLGFLWVQRRHRRWFLNRSRNAGSHSGDGGAAAKARSPAGVEMALSPGGVWTRAASPILKSDGSVNEKAAARSISIPLVQLEHDSFIGAVLLWCLLLVVFTFFNISSAYLTLLWIWPALIGRYIATRDPQYVVLVPAGGSSSTDGALVPAPRLSFFGLFFGSLAFPTMMSMQLLWVLPQFFIPIMGRSGSEVPGDVVVAIILAAIVSLISWMYASLMHWDPNFDRGTKRVLLFITIMCLGVALVVNPYARYRPKRLFAQHVERAWYGKGQIKPLLQEDGSPGEGLHQALLARAQHLSRGQPVDYDQAPRVSFSSGLAQPERYDAGFWLVGIDYSLLEPLRKVAIEDAKPGSAHSPAVRQINSKVATATYQKCEPGSVYCDFPWYFPLKDLIKGADFYIPVPRAPAFAPVGFPVLTAENSGVAPRLTPNMSTIPAWRSPASLTKAARPVPDWSSPPQATLYLLRETFVAESNRRRLYFSVVGPDHMGIVIDAKRSAPLLDWSFAIDERDHPAFSRGRQLAHREAIHRTIKHLLNTTLSKARTALSRAFAVPKAAGADADAYFVFFGSGNPTATAFPVWSSASTASQLSGPASPIQDLLTQTLSPERQWDFWIEVEGRAQDVHLSLTTHYLNDPTPLLLEYAKSLPSWIDSLTWTSLWSSYVF